MANRAESAPGPLLVVRREDATFPAAALDLADPPERLFVRGRWPVAGPAVAIVGSRAATPYGLQVAARLASDLARIGVTVVSGLAHGIDAAAHRAVLAAGGSTLAILPGGHDAIVPRGHVPLAGEIAKRGTLLSEYASGPPAHRGAFLERNRLIAALARAVVVVEARRKSGALNTAFHARRLGRPVLAVPGDVDRETSRGCHALLRKGARVCEDLADILAAIDAPAPARATDRDAEPPDDAERRDDAGRGGDGLAPDDPAHVTTRILDALRPGPRTAEACAQASGLALAHVQAVLLELEWAGLVEAAPGARWVRRDGGR